MKRSEKNAMSYQHSIIYLLNNQSLNQSISGTLWCLLYMFSACHVFILTSVKIYLCIILDKCSLSLQWRCCTVFSGHISQFCRNALTKHSKYCSLSATYFPTLTLSSINLCFPWMRKDRMSGESVCRKKEGRTNWIVLLPQNICIAFPQTVS